MIIMLGWMGWDKPMACLWEEVDVTQPFAEGRLAASLERAREYTQDLASAEGMKVYTLPSDEPYPHHRTREAVKDRMNYARSTKSLQRWDFNLNDIGAPNKDTLKREGKPLWHDKVQDMYQWNGQVFYITEKGAVHYFLYQ